MLAQWCRSRSRCRGPTALRDRVRVDQFERQLAGLDICRCPRRWSVGRVGPAGGRSTVTERYRQRSQMPACETVTRIAVVFRRSRRVELRRRARLKAGIASIWFIPQSAVLRLARCNVYRSASAGNRDLSTAFIGSLLPRGDERFIDDTVHACNRCSQMIVGQSRGAARRRRPVRHGSAPVRSWSLVLSCRKNDLCRLSWDLICRSSSFSVRYCVGTAGGECSLYHVFSSSRSWRRYDVQ